MHGLRGNRELGIWGCSMCVEVRCGVQPLNPANVGVATAPQATRPSRHVDPVDTVHGGNTDRCRGVLAREHCSVTQLKDVVVNQVEVAMAEGNDEHNGTEKFISVVVVPDATPFWKTSV